MIKLFRTLFFYFFFFWAIIFGLVPCYILSLLPKKIRYDNKLYFFFMAIFYTICRFGLLVPIKYEGADNIPDGPAIYVANHQSALDVLLVGILLACKPHIWLFKVELCKIPLYGSMAGRMNVPIDRTTPRRALYGLLESIRLTRGKNRSLVIFPEGGRYADGLVHDFLLGFAIIARKTKKPVVPIKIFDAYKVYPMGSFFVNYNQLRVVVGKSFVVENGETDEQFGNRVKDWFLHTT